MTLLAPQPPEWHVDWNALQERYPEVEKLKDCQQNPEFHAEGDVFTHTQLVVEKLIHDPSWQEYNEPTRAEIFAAAVLHDIGKPLTTTIEDGRIGHPGHARKGEIITRSILWRNGVEVATRERIANLVRFHIQAFHLIDQPDALRRLFHMSWTCGVDRLLLLARADAAGRISSSGSNLQEAVDLSEQLALDAGCLGAPFPFADDHSRFSWFRNIERDPNYQAHDTTRCEVTIMSGLPAAGKNYWVERNCADMPMVSLDDIRTAMGISASENQSGVVRAAREQARWLLRDKKSFVWNATNLSRSVRQQVVDFVADYDARIRIVAVEASPDTIDSRNRARKVPVPASVIDKLLRRWEAPDLTEAHEVIWVCSDH